SLRGRWRDRRRPAEPGKTEIAKLGFRGKRNGDPGRACGKVYYKSGGRLMRYLPVIWRQILSRFGFRVCWFAVAVAVAVFVKRASSGPDVQSRIKKAANTARGFGQARQRSA